MAEDEQTQQTDSTPSQEGTSAVATAPAAAPPAAPATPMARVDERIAARRQRESTAAGRELSRRSALRAGFFTALGLALVGAAYQFWNFSWPRKLTGFGGVINVTPERVPKPGGDPVQIIEGKFWLVNLKPEEGPFEQFGEPGPGGLLALYWKCPHLGCTVPWRSSFEFGGKPGWFRCPCHGSTYTKAGYRVFGPAPRPLDTMQVTVTSNGSVDVNTGVIKQGNADNAKRAVAYKA